MFVVSKDYNWLHDLIKTLIQRHKPTVLDNTKRGEMKAEAQVRGQLEGVSFALTSYATRVRLDRLPDLPSDDGRLLYHPAVDQYEVLKLLKQMLGDWDGGLWADQDDDKFFAWFDSQYNALIDAASPDYEARRRAEVRTGNMEPQAGDEVWLAEEANEAIKAAQPLRDLAAKAKAAGAV